MIYARVDVCLLNHPKALAAEQEAQGAMGLYLWSLLYVRSMDGDGTFPKLALKVAWCNALHSVTCSEALVKAGLWKERAGEQYEIVNYAAKNETRKEIEQRRALTRERVTRYRQKCNTLQTGYERVTNAFVPDSVNVFVSKEERVQGEKPIEAEPVESEPTKAQRQQMRENQYRDAYCKGIAEGKRSPYAWPGGMVDTGTLNLCVVTFARKGGKALRGDDVLAWIADLAADFAESVTVAGKAQFYSGYSPKGFQKWLNERTQMREAKENP